MKNAGFKQNTLHVIRPDSHVALVPDKQWLRALNMYLEALELWLLEWNEIKMKK